VANSVYTAHRENQRELILEVAEDLFIKHGIEHVTIGKIAKASRLTRATIYNYYANKEEIAQEIFKIVTRSWRDRHEREAWGFQGTGYERLANFMTSFFDYLLQNPREARFVAELNYLYAKHWSAEMFVESMLGNLQGDREFVLCCIQGGIADGSLRSDIEPELMLAAFFNFLSGMINRLGEMGDKLAVEYGMSAKTIFPQICELFLDGIRTEPSHQQGGRTIEKSLDVQTAAEAN